MNEVLVRDAGEPDIPAVQSIYAYYVQNGLASFEEVPPSVEELLRRWHAVRANGLPYLVADYRGATVGYSYATAYHPRSGYRYTVEDSVYVAEGVNRQGIGRALLEALIARCELGPWRQMIAVIGNRANVASIALHRRMGFQHVGILRSVGFKLGGWVDVVLMQRALSAGDGSVPSADPSPEYALNSTGPVRE